MENKLCGIAIHKNGESQFRYTTQPILTISPKPILTISPNPSSEDCMREIFNSRDQMPPPHWPYISDQEPHFQPSNKFSQLQAKLHPKFVPWFAIKTFHLHDNLTYTPYWYSKNPFDSHARHCFGANEMNVHFRLLSATPLSWNWTIIFLKYSKTIWRQCWKENISKTARLEWFIHIQFLIAATSISLYHLLILHQARQNQNHKKVLCI